MLVSAIVVTHNRLSLLKECLYNLLNQSYDLDKIFVINNKSTDNTKKYLSNLNDDKVIAFNSKKNLGGAGGFSLGTKLAFKKSDSDYFWLMDDDTMATKFALSTMMNKAKKLNYNFGFLCSNVRWWKDDTPALLNVPVVEKNWNVQANNGLIRVRYASFVSILISRKDISKLGLPISEMFIWADDVEYTTRISRYLPSYFVSNSIVMHKCKDNENDESIVTAEVNRLFYYKCVYRNRLYIYRNYYDFKRFFRMALTYLSHIIVIPFKAKDYRLKRIIYTIVGVWNGLFFNPQIKFPNRKK